MGSQAKPQTQTVQPPQWVQGAQQNMLGTVQNAISPFLTPQAFAPNADQAAAYSMLRTNAANPPSVAPVNFTAANPAQLGSTEYRSFLNPYTQDVVKTTMATAQADQERQLNEIRARAAAGSAFGGSGSRAALESSNARDAFNRTNESTVAQLMSRGFDAATASALANAQMRQQANIYNSQGANATAQFNANLGLRNIGLGQEAINNLMQAGNQQYDMAFKSQYGIPMQAVGTLASAIPNSYGTKTTTSAPQGPGTLQQMLGLAGTLGGAYLGGPMGGMIGETAGNAVGSVLSPADESGWTLGGQGWQTGF
jgi:hypothetical protein